MCHLFLPECLWMDRGVKPTAYKLIYTAVSNEMRLKLKRGLVTFENTIITNTRTINCFPILFPKKFLQITVTLYTTWTLIQGLVHRYSSLPRRRGFRHAFLSQDGEDCVKSQKTSAWEAIPSADWSHPARDTKVVYNKTKQKYIRL